MKVRMGIRVLIFTYSHQNGVVVGGIWLNEKINMGNYKQKVARKLRRQQKLNGTQVARIFLSPEGQCLWFSPDIFSIPEKPN